MKMVIKELIKKCRVIIVPEIKLLYKHKVHSVTVIQYQFFCLFVSDSFHLVRFLRDVRMQKSILSRRKLKDSFISRSHTSDSTSLYWKTSPFPEKILLTTGQENLTLVFYASE